MGEWTSVKDRLPEEGVDVLAVCRNEYNPSIRVQKVLCLEKNCWMGDDPEVPEVEQWGYEITHWMPLPEPPKEDADDP